MAKRRPASKPKSVTLTVTLRNAVNEFIEAGGSFNGLEKATGVLRQSLMLFARGQTGLHLEAADKLATFFKLELKPNSKS